MKKKMILALVMVTILAIGGAVFATNANFTAVANSVTNTFKMGTVGMQSDNGQIGQAIDLGTLFSETNAGTLEAGVVNTKTVAIKGTLPVTLSLGGLIPNPDPADVTKTGTAFKIAPVNIAAPSGVISSWWRHYKMNILVSVARTNGTTDSYTSRDSAVYGGFDSIFDAIEGTIHSPANETTTGLSALLSQLGTLNPGDVVTIKTTTKFVESTPVAVGFETLTQDQVNAFQGQSLIINLSLVATEAAKK